MNCSLNFSQHRVPSSRPAWNASRFVWDKNILIKIIVALRGAKSQAIRLGHQCHVRVAGHQTSIRSSSNSIKNNLKMSKMSTKK